MCCKCLKAGPAKNADGQVLSLFKNWAGTDGNLPASSAQ